MAGCGVDDGLIDAPFPHDLLGFDAVLVGILFKVQVVEQAHDGPEVLLLPIAQLLGEPAHHVRDGIGVFQVKFPLIVLLQKGLRFVICHRHNLLFLFYFHSPRRKAWIMWFVRL